jgi:DUF971 family protein
MEFEIPATAPPEDVELDRARHLRLRWADGQVTTFLLDTLRAACPCAQCRSRRDLGQPVPPPRAPNAPPLEARSAELVGNWGIQFHWSDGHDTGIFSWSLLHALAND